MPLRIPLPSLIRLIKAEIKARRVVAEGRGAGLLEEDVSDRGEVSVLNKSLRLLLMLLLVMQPVQYFLQKRKKSQKSL